MRDYARFQTATLLRRMAFQLNRAERHTDSDSVHDLRVAIRRLSRCLRTFAPLYPGRYWKKIRRELSALMEATAAEFARAFGAHYDGWADGRGTIDHLRDLRLGENQPVTIVEDEPEVSNTGLHAILARGARK